MDKSTSGRVSAACVVLALAGTAAALAATGLPVLDPSGNTTGTAYTFTAAGAAKTMETPPPAGSAIRVGGTLTIFQDQGENSFDADMLLDTDGDTVPDRELHCDGRVGSGRFGLRCEDNDGMGDISFVLAGRALMLGNGKVVLREATGSGFTEDSVFKVNLKATQY